MKVKGEFDSMIEEFPYLKLVIFRFEGDPSPGIDGEINRFKRLIISREIQMPEINKLFYYV